MDEIQDFKEELKQSTQSMKPLAFTYGAGNWPSYQKDGEIGSNDVKFATGAAFANKPANVRNNQLQEQTYTHQNAEYNFAPDPNNADYYSFNPHQ